MESTSFALEQIILKLKTPSFRTIVLCTKKVCRNASATEIFDNLKQFQQNTKHVCIFSWSDILWLVEIVDGQKLLSHWHSGSTILRKLDVFFSIKYYVPNIQIMSFRQGVKWHI